MQELIDFILRAIAATLLLYLINSIFHLTIPYHVVNIVLIAFLGVPGAFIVIVLTYLFNK